MREDFVPTISDTQCYQIIQRAAWLIYVLHKTKIIGSQSAKVSESCLSVRISLHF